MIEINGKQYIDKEYFDKDYFETSGYKSGYNKSTLRHDSFLNKAIAVWITQTLKLGGGERILEIGCAYGWVVEQMVKFYGFDAYGQDISTYSTSNAPSDIEARIHECENVEIAFDGKFDLVYSMETFEHVPKPLVDEYFKNIYEALNEDGILFCTICLGHNDDRGSDIDRSHQTLQPRKWWNAKLEEAGFTIRKDLEAEAYELGLQTADMASGKYLPREFNWHVFIAQKKEPIDEIKLPKWTISDRQLLEPRKNAPKLLVIGSRAGAFTYPIADFFQIDNWGNYLAHYFNAEYRTIRDHHWKDIDFAKYDLVIGALNTPAINAINQVNNIKKLVAFLDGTLSMMMEEHLNKRETWLKTLDKVDIILSPGTNGKSLMNILGFECHDLSHIFPFRWFDQFYQRHNNEQFTILCSGYFESHSSLTATSAFLASTHADKVLIATYPDSKVEVSQITIPDNIELFRAMDQVKYYSSILSQADIFLKMDNLSWCGRGIAEAAAGRIPSISSQDLYQIRCFPELMVSNYDDLENIINNIQRIRSDPELRTEMGNHARERLIVSNRIEYSKMITLLQQLGFDIEDNVDEQYW